MIKSIKIQFIILLMLCFCALICTPLNLVSFLLTIALIIQIRVKMKPNLPFKHFYFLSIILCILEFIGISTIFSGFFAFILAIIIYYLLHFKITISKKEKIILVLIFLFIAVVAIYTYPNVQKTTVVETNTQQTQNDNQKPVVANTNDTKNNTQATTQQNQQSAQPQQANTNNNNNNSNNNQPQAQPQKQPTTQPAVQQPKPQPAVQQPKPTPSQQQSQPTPKPTPKPQPKQVPQHQSSTFIQQNNNQVGVITRGGGRYHNTADLHSGPSTSSPKQGSLHTGDQVTVLRHEGDWLYVQSGNQTGYVYRGFVHIQ